MISRNNRFHGRASIQRLYKNSKMVRSGSFGLRYAQNPRRNEYRLAVVVSRKVSKSAVVRNRIRRRIYEYVRILSTSFDGPTDLLLTVYDESVAEMPTEALRQEVTKLLQKAKVVTPEAPAHAIVEPKK
jgi:ribonuclease P protein component